MSQATAQVVLEDKCKLTVNGGGLLALMTGSVWPQ